jgi:hypothetical protein
MSVRGCEQVNGKYRGLSGKTRGSGRFSTAVFKLAITILHVTIPLLIGVGLTFLIINIPVSG